MHTSTDTLETLKSNIQSRGGKWYELEEAYLLKIEAQITKSVVIIFEIDEQTLQRLLLEADNEMNILEPGLYQAHGWTFVAGDTLRQIPSQLFCFYCYSAMNYALEKDGSLAPGLQFLRNEGLLPYFCNTLAKTKAQTFEHTTYALKNLQSPTLASSIATIELTTKGRILSDVQLAFPELSLKMERLREAFNSFPTSANPDEMKAFHTHVNSCPKLHQKIKNIVSAVNGVTFANIFFHQLEKYNV